MLKNGDKKGKLAMSEEITRMAKLADLYVKSEKENRDAKAE